MLGEVFLQGAKCGYHLLETGRSFFSLLQMKTQKVDATFSLAIAFFLCRGSQGMQSGFRRRGIPHFAFHRRNFIPLLY
jgi:hypothetical protein